jgi:valyl-tRNA synthetase
MHELPKTYDPHQVEARRYEWELARGDFEATIADDGRPRYSITIPPPNITGSLHMGHALNNAIHDVLLRWKRMQGYNVLCVPGTDHAGIATQNVVERALRQQEGLTRHDLGREKFLERVWQWREQYGNTILMQFRKLGCSYDWRYTRFTLDPEYVDAVLEVFVRWWQDGHLYIGERVINWCPRCMTAISDIEIEQSDEAGKLYHIRYPFVDGDGYVVVATTRPETMLGDVAVAVNPSDARYTDRIGKSLRLPLVERIIPLIADPYPDPAFGTGAVKVTPAHDPNDFEIGQRHNLPRPVIMHLDGTIDTEALRESLNAHDNPYLQRYHGVDRYKAREMIVQDLEANGYLEKVEDYTVPLARCERCHTVIEPLLSEQWFCRMQSIAQPAIEVVRQGKIRFHPERYKEMYLHWMENIRDWCISRQLWWGHQIPAWYCMDCHPENFDESGKLLRRESPIVQKTEPDKCPRCGSTRLVRDPDVLDTWFSSAIWPHTVLGWPQPTDELRLFYPTDVLITAQEILYLWVARMVMTGLYFMGDIPFREVYIHATVLNKEGKRMSKSLGTGIDPLELIDKYGADALRWSLLQQAGMQQSIRFYEERVVSARNFANKVWNATRFVLLNLDGSGLERPAGNRRAACRRARLLDTQPPAAHDSDRAGRAEPLLLRRRRERAVRIYLERGVRLVHRGGQAAPARPRLPHADAGDAGLSVRPVAAPATPLHAAPHARTLAGDWRDGGGAVAGHGALPRRRPRLDRPRRRSGDRAGIRWHSRRSQPARGGENHSRRRHPRRVGEPDGRRERGTPATARRAHRASGVVSGSALRAAD